jgi:hypothetical protein
MDGRLKLKKIFEEYDESKKLTLELIKKYASKMFEIILNDNKFKKFISDIHTYSYIYKCCCT